MSVTSAATAWPGATATELPRVLAGLGTAGTAVGIDEHLSRWGHAPFRQRNLALFDEVEASGLTGRGGAAFPVAAKWRSVRDAGIRRPVVVANGSEGEPASSKDRLLLHRLPHLVLDGASLAAISVHAGEVVLYVPAHAVAPLERAIVERRSTIGDPIRFEIVVAPDTFLAGQETAVVNALNRGDPRPTFGGVRPIRVRGVHGRPTLVQNVETLANVAMISRYGATWFRAIGAPSSPGTALLTINGYGPRQHVLEVPTGVVLRQALGLSGEVADRFQGVLFGGYGGGWVPTPAAFDLPLTESELRQHGATVGAGVVALLSRNSCPLVATAGITQYLERQGAGQCGPCVHGLAELADLTALLAIRPAVLRGRTQDILDVCDLIDGRGACRHPDGAARLVRSALTAFPEHVATHLHDGPCANVATPSELPGLEPLQGRRRSPAVKNP